LIASLPGFGSPAAIISLKSLEKIRLEGGRKLAGKWLAILAGNSRGMGERRGSSRGP
jgi:hypothetical protein